MSQDKEEVEEEDCIGFKEISAHQRRSSKALKGRLLETFMYENRMEVQVSRKIVWKVK